MPCSHPELGLPLQGQGAVQQAPGAGSAAAVEAAAPDTAAVVAVAVIVVAATASAPVTAGLDTVAAEQAVLHVSAAAAHDTVAAELQGAATAAVAEAALDKLHVASADPDRTVAALASLRTAGFVVADPGTAAGELAAWSLAPDTVAAVAAADTEGPALEPAVPQVLGTAAHQGPGTVERLVLDTDAAVLLDLDTVAAEPPDLDTVAAPVLQHLDTVAEH